MENKIDLFVINGLVEATKQNIRNRWNSRNAKEYNSKDFIISEIKYLRSIKSKI